MKYESKHKELKNIANNIASRVNICKSIALKYQLKFSHSLYGSKIFKFDIQVGKISFLIINTLNFNEILINNLTKSKFIENNNLHTTTFVRICNIIYKEKYFILINKINKEFAEIKHILVRDDGEICFIYQKYQTLTFHTHF